MLSSKALLPRLRCLLKPAVGVGALWYSGISTLARRRKWVKPTIVHVGDSGWALSITDQSIRQHLRQHYHFGPQFAWRGLRNSLVHFGSPPAFFEKKLYSHIHPSNKQVVTWTHGQRTNPDPRFAERLDNVHEAAPFMDKIIVTSQIGAKTLLAEGINQNKLVRIPLGIDTRLFYTPTREQRISLRKQLVIPETAYCVGSFQKDGEGWDEGLSPKWVKGPDIFLQVIQRLRHDHELCVLLTAPARGYVKKGLERMRVPYRHVQPKKYPEMAKYYWALDLYIIASRDEGGPLSLLESMASGVPLVSTRVGMCADLLREGENGLLVEVEDVEGLALSAARILGNRGLRHTITLNALQTAQRYDWCVIANRYHQEVYRPLLIEAGYKGLL